MNKERKALLALYLSLVERNRFSEDDANIMDTRKHQAIDFTGAQLKRIGKALKESRTVLEEGQP